MHSHQLHQLIGRGFIQLQGCQGRLQLGFGAVTAGAITQHTHHALRIFQLTLKRCGLLRLILLQELVEVLATQQQMAHPGTGIKHRIQIEILLGVFQH